MKVRCIYKDSKFLKYNKIYEVLEESNKSYKVKDEDGEESNFYKWKFEEVKEMEKTFREVIADIKEGEVWESHCKRIIGLSCGDIKICDKDNDNFGASLVISSSNIYKLKRKEYAFEEAFKAYEEGKEIESVLTGDRFKKSKRLDGSNFDSCWDESLESWWKIVYFELELIRGKWYIND